MDTKSAKNLQDEIQTLIEKGKSGSFTESDALRVDQIVNSGLVEKSNQYLTDLKRQKAVAEGEALVKAMADTHDLDMSNEFGHTGANAQIGTLTRESFAKSAKQIAAKSVAMSRSKGVSAILPGAEISVPIMSPEIRPLGRQTHDFLEILKFNTIQGRHYSYVKQTGRVVNAAVVPAGELKPTSEYSMELIDGQTNVVAHLSQPIDEFLLRDAESLGAVVANEMVGGLWETLNNQIVNGTGAATKQLTGILNTSGIQTQAFTVDALTTIRTSFTRLREAGREPEVVVLNPTDWQGLELLRATAGGEFLLGANGPIDAAKRTLWGVQVVESFAVPAGTAIILQQNAAKIMISEPGTIVTWHVSGDGFERNTGRFRAETRVNLAVELPDAIVKATITGE